LLLCQKAFLAPAVARRDSAPHLHWIWLVLTILGFAISSLALYLVVCAILLSVLSRREPVPIALFVALILAMPDVPIDLPTFGLAEHIIQVGFTTVMALVLLLPTALGNRLPRRWATVARNWVVLEFAWLAFLGFISASFTGFLRLLVEQFLTLYLPFQGARKSITTLDQVHRAMALFTSMATALSVIAVFEYAKGWLLYATLPGHWGVEWGALRYLARGTALRAQVSLGQPIAVGFVIAVALLMAQTAALYRGRPKWRLAIIAILSAGLFASISRGPWIGAVAGTLLFTAMGPGGLKQVLRLAASGAALLVIVAFLPGGEKIIDLLPWIGTADPGSTSYRKDLFDSITPLLIDNPIFGLPDYDTRPELQHLRQGEHLIDLVNSYIGVGVSSGLVGLAIYLMAHGVVVRGLWKCLKRLSGDEHELVRGFFSAYLTGLMVIATVSSIGVISPILWVMCGVGSGIVAVVAARASASTSTAATRSKDPGRTRRMLNQPSAG
jgi:hypothetical protein